MPENKSTQLATTHTHVGISTIGAKTAVQWTPEQVELIKTQILKGGSDDDLQVFLYQCARTGLDPFTRQIYGIKRWDDDAKKMTVGVQLSIDGLRLVAERTGRYKGQTAYEWCGTDGVWKDVWLSNDPPAAARVGVIKDGFEAPLYRIARFSAYAGKKKDGGLTRMWATMGDVMIAKCAEALALRTAFPQELSGLYAGEEMDQGGGEQPENTTPAKTNQKGKAKQSDLMTIEQSNTIDDLCRHRTLTTDQRVWLEKRLVNSSRERADDTIEQLKRIPLDQEESSSPAPTKEEPKKTVEELRKENPTQSEIDQFKVLAQGAKLLLTDSEKTGMNNEFRRGYTGTGIRSAIEFLTEVIAKRSRRAAEGEAA